MLNSLEGGFYLYNSLIEELIAMKKKAFLFSKVAVLFALLPPFFLFRFSPEVVFLSDQFIFKKSFREDAISSEEVDDWSSLSELLDAVFS